MARNENKMRLMESIKKSLNESNEIQRVLPPADADAFEQHEQALKQNAERKDPKNYDKLVKELIEDTASEKSRYRHFDVVDRKDLAKKINEAKERGQKFKISRNTKPGYRYNLDILIESKEMKPLDDRFENLVLNARNRMANANDKIAELNSIIGEVENIIDYDKSTNKDELIMKGKKLISDLIKGFDIDKDELKSKIQTNNKDAYKLTESSNLYDAMMAELGAVEEPVKESIKESVKKVNKKSNKSINEDLKVYTSSLEGFQPSVKAADFWKEIVSANKIDDLAYSLDNLYPAGLSDVALDHFLCDEESWIRDMINLPYSDEGKDEGGENKGNEEGKEMDIEKEVDTDIDIDEEEPTEFDEFDSYYDDYNGDIDYVDDGPTPEFDIEEEPEEYYPDNDEEPIDYYPEYDDEIEFEDEDEEKEEVEESLINESSNLYDAMMKELNASPVEESLNESSNLYDAMMRELDSIDESLDDVKNIKMDGVDVNIDKVEIEANNDYCDDCYNDDYDIEPVDYDDEEEDKLEENNSTKLNNKFLNENESNSLERTPENAKLGREKGLPGYGKEAFAKLQSERTPENAILGRKLGIPGYGKEAARKAGLDDELNPIKDKKEESLKEAFDDEDQEIIGKLMNRGHSEEDAIDLLAGFSNSDREGILKESVNLREDREEDADKEIEARRNNQVELKKAQDELNKRVDEDGKLIICIDVSGSNSYKEYVDTLTNIASKLSPDKILYFSTIVSEDASIAVLGGGTDYDKLFNEVMVDKKPNDIIYVLTDEDFKYNNRYNRRKDDWNVPNVHVLNVRDYFDPLTSTGRGKYSKYFSGDIKVFDNERKEADRKANQRERDIKNMTGPAARAKAAHTDYQQWGGESKPTYKPKTLSQQVMAELGIDESLELDGDYDLSDTEYPDYIDIEDDDIDNSKRFHSIEVKKEDNPYFKLKKDNIEEDLEVLDGPDAEDDEMLESIANGFVEKNFKSSDDPTVEKDVVKEAVQKAVEEEDEVVAVDDDMINEMLGTPTKESK